MILRCPACGSSVLLERERDRLALVCLGCGRRREQLTPRERAYRAEISRLRSRQQQDQQLVRSPRLP